MHSATRRHRPTPYLLVGGLCGLTWAAGLRGWMAQLVWPASSYTWLTVVLIMLPGLVIGLLLGWAAYARSLGIRSSRWLVFTPALFAVALLDPEIFRSLISDGQGGGALIVVFTALAGGFALSRRRWPARLGSGLVALLGLLLLGAIGGMAGPLSSARGAWVSLYGFSFILLLCLASVLPYPAVRPPRGAWSFTAFGALCGLAWVSALRGFMAEVAGAESQVEWVNTWGFILLPGMLIGALLGLAEFVRRTGGRPRWHLLALSPLLFAAILVAGLIEEPTHMFEGGIGAGAIAIPILVMIGGHAMSGRGSLWTRVPAGMVGAATLVVWPLTATAVGGPSFALTTPQGLWATVLYDGLLVTFALAASVPQREPVRTGAFPDSASTVTQAEEADHDHSAAV
jgi:hypothetical protein